MTTDSKQTEIEAAAFRRLLQHLIIDRSEVQNIDLMNLAGFCRNCLSQWYQDAALANGLEISKDEARRMIYGMDFSEWKAKFQNEANAEQLAAFAEQQTKHT